MREKDNCMGVKHCQLYFDNAFISRQNCYYFYKSMDILFLSVLNSFVKSTIQSFLTFSFATICLPGLALSNTYLATKSYRVQIVLVKYMWIKTSLFHDTRHFLCGQLFLGKNRHNTKIITIFGLL